MCLTDDLSLWFYGAKRIVLVGVGNPIRRDDNIGVEIVNDLEGKVPQSVLLIKSETMPEDFLNLIIKFGPTHILIIDAAILNLSPGSARLFQSIVSSNLAISTHALPIQIFCEYLSKTTEAKIAMLLIQPKDTDFGEGLTYELNLAKEKMVDCLIKILRLVQN